MKWHTADVLDYGLLKMNAQENRKYMTEAESVFWNVAKCGGFGQKCRRQYIIGPYIVDFFFRKSLLIVEIDGGYHREEAQKKEDAVRQEYLEQKGYKVIRFSNEEIICDTDRVIQTIKVNL